LSYDKCLVCGGEYSCLHHFVLKSQSFTLRYNFSNGIPVCQSCHFSIHQGQNDLIVGQIIRIMGMDWFNKLEEAKKKTTPDTLEHIRGVVEVLQQTVDKSR